MTLILPGAAAAVLEATQVPPKIKWTDELEGFLFAAIMKTKVHMPKDKSEKKSSTKDAKWNSVVALLISSNKFPSNEAGSSVTYDAVTSKWRNVCKELRAKKDPKSNTSRHKEMTPNQTLAMTLMEQHDEVAEASKKESARVAKQQEHMRMIEGSILSTAYAHEESPTANSSKRQRSNDDEEDEDEVENEIQTSTTTTASSTSCASRSSSLPGFSELQRALTKATDAKVQLEEKKLLAEEKRLEAEERWRREEIASKERMALAANEMELKRMEMMIKMMQANKSNA